MNNGHPFDKGRNARVSPLDSSVARAAGMIEKGKRSEKERENEKERIQRTSNYLSTRRSKLNKRRIFRGRIIQRTLTTARNSSTHESSLPRLSERYNRRVVPSRHEDNKFCQ